MGLFPAAVYWRWTVLGDVSRIENIQCFKCARRLRSGPWREASYGNRQAGMEG